MRKNKNEKYSALILECHLKLEDDDRRHLGADQIC